MTKKIRKLATRITMSAVFVMAADAQLNVLSVPLAVILFLTAGAGAWVAAFCQAWLLVGRVAGAVSKARGISRINERFPPFHHQRQHR